jgi:hypothetical protein|tara:strand:- start:997 stop:1173 length:177 start_codon:yes stop_codon:yes gene_type:complete
MGIVMPERTENTKQWQDSSDGWVSTMTKSKENKEEYQKYVNKTERPIPYRDWLRGKDE